MERRSFLKSLIALTATAIIAPQMIVEQNPKTYYDEFSRRKEEALKQHKMDMERADFFGIEIKKVETPFGIINFISR